MPLVLGELFAAGADRRQHFLQDHVQALLDDAVAQAAAHVMGFHLGQRRFFRVERIEVRKGDVAFQVARVFHAQVQRVRVDFFHGGRDFGRGRAQVDGVAQRLAHLRLAVDAGQAADIGHQRLAFHQHFAVVHAVEAAHDFIRLLDHRDLVFAHGHHARLEGRDVGRLAGRVGQKTGRNVALEAAQADFFLDGGVALEARHGDDVQVVKGQLGQFRDLRLDEDRGLARIDADGQIVQRHFDDIAVHLVDVFHIVRQRLRVGQHDELLVAVLVADAVAQAAHIVAQVQGAGRAVARQDHGLRSDGGSRQRC